ncbi:MAG: hypothetical protein V2I25_12675 [Woeseiaceae bacterium]|jgi:hypothetical protein|nr:hypothetical protein [Woeseiaceae bacterium]
MADIEKLVEELKQKRDELRVQMHLASKEAKDEWDEIEDKWEDFSRKANLEATGEGLGDAMEKLGEELKLGYQRIRKALKD